MLKTKFYRLLAAAMLTAVLGLMGCVSGSSTTPSTPLLVLPATASVTPGAPTVFTISGGVKNYSVFSSNTAVISFAGSAITDNTFIVNAANVFVDTPVTLSVTDSANAKVDLTVTVKAPSSSPLAVSPAAASGTVGQVLSFVVTGGIPGYAVTSNNSSIAATSSVGSAGGQYIFTATLAGAGTGKLILTDANKNIVTVDLTATAAPSTPAAALYTTAPAAVTIPVGGTPTSYAIGGGSAPYTASSSNSSVATASVNGSTLTLSGVAAGSANILVFDAKGSSVTIAATVGGVATPLYTTAPSAVTIAVGGTGSYTIAGGTSPYSVSSSNSAVASVNVSSPSFTITGGAAGTASIVVRDSTGTAPITIAVTVASSAGAALYTTAPLAITISAIGGTQTYTIGGGTAPYQVNSDNTNVATASLIGTSMVITGKADGKANVLVQDATGSASVKIAVNVATGTGFTVIGSAPAWTISGNGDTVLTNDCNAAAPSPYSVFFINGGTPPYTVSSTSPLVGTILGVGTDTVSFPTPSGAKSVNLNTVTVTENGGYFVVAWPNANNNCASGDALFKVIDATGLVPALTPTFKVTFTPS